ncbi:type II toxin-antitoxin system VapC family toxin [Microcoleus sp. BR0-C5]|uniref:type II toxin-antitoxin system VapC family toxin n=1 Tax=Microcoleus sp. BR0-C5 TaxID=2818713 RepID=UPI002FCF2739
MVLLQVLKLLLQLPEGRAAEVSINATDATAACNQFRSDLQSEYQVVEFTETIINSAMALAETYGLPGYDAVQLATGCGINNLCTANSLPAMTFVSADKRISKVVPAT